MGRKTNTVVSLALATLAALAETSVDLGAQTASVQPPASATALGSFRAAGVQIYVCGTGQSAGNWVLKEPDADLFDASGRPIIHHSVGPTWQARKGAKVSGKLLAKAPSPDAGAIAWLLLDATSTGTGLLAGTRYVVRRDTKGGVAPAGTCAAGATARVPYGATYEFYR